MRQTVVFLFGVVAAAVSVVVVILWVSDREPPGLPEAVLAACREDAQYGGLAISYPLDGALAKATAVRVTDEAGRVLPSQVHEGRAAGVWQP